MPSKHTVSLTKPALSHRRSRLSRGIARLAGLNRQESSYTIGIMQLVTDQIRNFLQYTAVQFIEHPQRAQLKVAELGPNRLRFKLILEQSDVAFLIGRNGFSASAIRGVVKAASERANVQATLQIHSHEEEQEMLARGDQS